MVLCHIISIEKQGLSEEKLSLQAECFTCRFSLIWLGNRSTPFGPVAINISKAKHKG
jgi:hypothetical protein